MNMDIENSHFNLDKHAKSIIAQVGSVLLWLTAKEDHDFDTRMYHMGCPVLHGHKWVVTKWVCFG